jgi:hypothetical protein
MLKPLLSRLAVLLLTCDIYLIVTTSSVQKTLQTMPAGDANLWPGQVHVLSAGKPGAT